MTEAYLECCYTILTNKNTLETKGDYTFNKSEDGLDINAVISKTNVTVKVTGFELTQQEIDALSNLELGDGDKVSTNLANKIDASKGKARSITREILQLIKYNLRHEYIHENLFSIKYEKWSVSSCKLRDIPCRYTVTVDGSSRCPLRDDSYEYLKQSINSSVQPLMAMNYLHRARRENLAHYKWVDATIAAELAIKEALSIANPNIEDLLLEMPSPPLSKLYGKIMESYLGEKSPYRKALIKGAEIRNQLVHRHDKSIVDEQEAINYVKDVEGAIFHLLSLIYPNDLLIKSSYERIKQLN